MGKQFSHTTGQFAEILAATSLLHDLVEDGGVSKRAELGAKMVTAPDLSENGVWGSGVDEWNADSPNSIAVDQAHLDEFSAGRFGSGPILGCALLHEYTHFNDVNVIVSGSWIDPCAYWQSEIDGYQLEYDLFSCYYNCFFSSYTDEQSDELEA